MDAQFQVIDVAPGLWICSPIHDRAEFERARARPPFGGQF